MCHGSSGSIGSHLLYILKYNLSTMQDKTNGTFFVILIKKISTNIEFIENLMKNITYTNELHDVSITMKMSQLYLNVLNSCFHGRLIYCIICI